MRLLRMGVDKKQKKLSKASSISYNLIPNTYASNDLLDLFSKLWDKVD